MQIQTVKLTDLESLRVGDELVVLAFKEHRISIANEGSFRHHLGKVIAVEQEQMLGLNRKHSLRYRIMGVNGMIELSADTDLSEHFQVWKLEISY